MTRALRRVRATSCLVAGLAVVSLVPSPCPASAATVEVVEAVGEASTAELRFVASPGESNRVRIVQRDADADHYELELVDAISSLHPGPGCSGGASPGTPTICVLHKPHQSESSCYGKGCVPVISGGWSTSATFVLGNVGSSLDSSATDIDEKVTAGAGNDGIVTGSGRDEVDSGAGADTVITGSGRDLINANAVPDGPDVYELGSGDDAPRYTYQVAERGDVIDYRERVERVELRVDELANDGSPGEKDEVLEAEVIRSGTANDLLVGDAHTDVFFGGPGNDRLIGGGASDSLNGETGDDRMIGAAGSDEMHDGGRLGGGDDFAASGKGTDFVELGPGADRALGGSGDDAITLGGGGDIGVGGPGDDDIRAGSGNDRLVGNDGADELLGSSGRDAIVASTIGGGPASQPRTAHGRVDEKRDTIVCGGEVDAASINPWDEVQGCERIFSLPRPLLQPPSHDHHRSPNN